MSCCLPKKPEIVDHVGENYVFGPATLSLRVDRGRRGLGRRTFWIDYTFALTKTRLLSFPLGRGRGWPRDQLVHAGARISSAPALPSQQMGSEGGANKCPFQIATAGGAKAWVLAGKHTDDLQAWMVAMHTVGIVGSETDEAIESRDEKKKKQRRGTLSDKIGLLLASLPRLAENEAGEKSARSKRNSGPAPRRSLIPFANLMRKTSNFGTARVEAPQSKPNGRPTKLVSLGSPTTTTTPLATASWGNLDDMASTTKVLESARRAQERSAAVRLSAAAPMGKKEGGSPGDVKGKEGKGDMSSGRETSPARTSGSGMEGSDGDGDVLAIHTSESMGSALAWAEGARSDAEKRRRRRSHHQGRRGPGERRANGRGGGGGGGERSNGGEEERQRRRRTERRARPAAEHPSGDDALASELTRAEKNSRSRVEIKKLESSPGRRHRSAPRGDENETGRGNRAEGSPGRHHRGDGSPSRRRHRGGGGAAHHTHSTSKASDRPTARRAPGPQPSTMC